MPDTTMDWTGWLADFRTREDRPLPTLDTDHDYHLLPRSLARSIAVFQLGESGGGTVIDQARRSDLPGADDDYAEALALFVAEENRHANILALCVRLMNGQLLKQNWTARLFVFGRRLMGLRLKVAVLLAAEVVGLCFYRLIAERLPPGVMQSWLREMAEDEERHLGFHTEFLRRQASTPLRRTVFLVAWRILMWTAGTVVLIDHRHTLDDLYIERREVRRLWQAWCRLIEEQVLTAGRAELSSSPARRSGPRPVAGFG